MGVPEIVPVDVEKDSPAGSVGEIDQDVTGPPLDCGVVADIVVPFVNERELGE